MKKYRVVITVEHFIHAESPRAARQEAIDRHRTGHGNPGNWEVTYVGAIIDDDLADEVDVTEDN